MLDFFFEIIASLFIDSFSEFYENDDFCQDSDKASHFANRDNVRPLQEILEDINKFPHETEQG